MSTSYHALPDNITSLDVTYGRETSTAVLAFADGATLRLEGDIGWIGLLLRGLARDMGEKYVARRSNGQITVKHPGRDSHWAVSDYGELVTLGDLREGRAP